MKENHYVVTFKNGKKVFATAFNEEDAKILAMAEMIARGMSREIETTTKVSMDACTTCDYQSPWY